MTIVQLIAQIVVVGYSLAPNPAIVVTPTSHSVVLSWTASTTTDVTAYSIYRGTASGGPYTKLATFQGLRYTDIGVVPGTTYYYVATATDPSGESAFSNEASGLIPGGYCAQMSWTAVTGAATYKLSRSTVSGGPYTAVKSGLTATSYSDSGLTHGTTYYYVIDALDSTGALIVRSNQISATP